MKPEKKIDEIVPEIVAALATCKHCPVGLRKKGLNLSGQEAVHEVLNDIISVLFPGCHSAEIVPEKTLARHLHEKLEHVASVLTDQVEQAFEYGCSQHECDNCADCRDRAEDAVVCLMEALPGTRKIIQEDIVAAYEGDPAAQSTMEVVMSYPGVYAVLVHRIAHLLHLKEVPLIPRIMSEYAHSRTGIDIHPGAQIGPGFFIDHGTGVVIGETSVIGRKVKLYQGVTLGALSFENDENGNPIKGVKRHPNVEDHVVIYSGATVLGDVTIGKHSVIGGNVWLTHSVPPHSTVYNRQPKPLITQNGDSADAESN